jgi:hypothetical protein
MIDLLRRQFKECASWKRRGERMDRLYLSLESLVAGRDRLTEEAANRILRRAARPLVKTHSLPDFAPWRASHERWLADLLRQATIYYVLRDGRSVLCSLHRFVQGFEAAARCSIGEFMRQTVNGESRPRIWANHVEQWIDEPRAHVLKYEELLRGMRDILERIGQQTEMTPLYREPLLPRPIGSVWQSRFARVMNRRPESTAIVATYRPGRTEKWQTTFTEDDRAFFHREAGNVLIRLGYEVSDAWVGQATCSASSQR